MTRLLVSVRSAEEAVVAVAAGAHLIDVKEPLRGALGAADLSTIVQVVGAVAGRVPVSAALGELMGGELAVGPTLKRLPSGLRYAKFGLAHATDNTQWVSLWRHRLAELPAAVCPVAVAYADWQTARAPHPADVLAAAIELRCGALLVDTFRKSGGALFDLLNTAQLAKLVAEAQRAKLLVVLAGSLTAETFAQAAALGPDYLAVRGAACAGGRETRLCEARVRHLAELLKKPEHSAVLCTSAAPL